MIIGIVIGSFVGLLLRPALDAYVLWRAQQEQRDARFDITELERLTADADPRP
jgi:hypothetical protein